MCKQDGNFVSTVNNTAFDDRSLQLVVKSNISKGSVFFFYANQKSGFRYYDIEILFVDKWGLDNLTSR